MHRVERLNNLKKYTTSKAVLEPEMYYRLVFKLERSRFAKGLLKLS
jgi:hypothetical protein